MSVQGRAAFIALRGVIFATLFVLLWLWLATVVRQFDAAIPLSMPTWLQPLGFAFASAGSVLVASCVAVFITRGEGTPAPFDPPRSFVLTGPYRYVRNPMYLGAVCVLLGGAVSVRSPSVALLALGFGFLAHSFVMLYEEPALEERFGESYAQYKLRVRRWVPRVLKPRPRGRVA